MILRPIATLVIAICSFFFVACGQASINRTAQKGIAQFETFKHKEKFIKDEQLHYPGMADIKMKLLPVKKSINQQTILKHLPPRELQRKRHTRMP